MNPRPSTPMIPGAVHFSLDQFLRMIDAGVFAGDDDQRIELLEGEMRNMTTIGYRQARIVDRLTEWSVENRPKSKVWVRVQQPLELPAAQSLPQPDIAWVDRDFPTQYPRAEHVRLLIEVADTSATFDLGRKAELYAGAGIADYWVVDLEAGCLEVLREPEQGRYRSLVTLRAGGVAVPLAFPEIGLPVGELLAE